MKKPQFREDFTDRGTSTAILDWYDHHARVLPWRISPADRARGVRPDPYRVWLSEVMLQQTTVATVKSYFERFTCRWPTVELLAAEPQDEVLKEWAGLGYYARARNLHKCAQVLVKDFDGVFPGTKTELLTLPGIGAYTAAAIASIAFDERATVLDGNVERVMARFFAIEAPLPRSKKVLYEAADRLTPDERSGDYAQAVMDLGATICTPRNPACGLCPLMGQCIGRKTGLAESLPRKTPKKAKPTRTGIAFVAVRSDGAILLDRRPQTGLLGGMMEVPGSEWAENFVVSDAVKHAPVDAVWYDVSDALHSFTHFHLRLAVKRADVPMTAKPIRGHWISAEDALTQALPTVMKKVLAVGIGSPWS